MSCENTNIPVAFRRTLPIPLPHFLFPDSEWKDLVDSIKADAPEGHLRHLNEEAVFIRTKRHGLRTAILQDPDGYTYKKSRMIERSGKIRWRCRMSRTDATGTGCKGKAVTMGAILETVSNHNHPVSHSKI